jgi:CheY-like chemotaxis protein
VARVLVIDDDSDIRALIGAILHRRGIRVEEAQDGFEGLSKARANPPDLILCDLVMPVMSGSATLAECRRDAALRSIPFLMITGMAHVVDEHGLLAAGANGLLPKPFTSTMLIETVSSHLNGTASASASQSLQPSNDPRPLRFLPREVSGAGS